MGKPCIQKHSTWGSTLFKETSCRRAFLFILALGQIIQQYVQEEGMKCGRILKIKVPGYADDLALVDTMVEQ